MTVPMLIYTVIITCASKFYLFVSDTDTTWKNDKGVINRTRVKVKLGGKCHPRWGSKPQSQKVSMLLIYFH